MTDLDKVKKLFDELGIIYVEEYDNILYNKLDDFKALKIESPLLLICNMRYSSVYLIFEKESEIFKGFIGVGN